jgi:hypothetical protein
MVGTFKIGFFEKLTIYFIVSVTQRKLTHFLKMQQSKIRPGNFFLVLSDFLFYEQVLYGLEAFKS